MRGREDNGLVGRFVVMHSGNVGHAQDLETLVRAAVLLQRPRPARDRDHRLRGPSRGARRARRANRRHERSLPALPAARGAVGLALRRRHPLPRARARPRRLRGPEPDQRHSLRRPAGHRRRRRRERVGRGSSRRRAAGSSLPPGDARCRRGAIRRAYEGELELEAMGAAGRSWIVAHRAKDAAIARYRELLGGLARSRERERGMIARYGRPAVSAPCRARSDRRVEHPALSARSRLRRHRSHRLRPGDPRRQGASRTGSASTTRRPASMPSPPASIWIGETLGLGQPLRVVQLVDAVLLLATAVLLLELALLVFPGRRRLHLAALGLFVFGVLAPRSAAMVHPETMSMFFTTLALVLAARMIVRRAWTVPAAVGLGAALGAGQLVRAFSLWTFARRRARARRGRVSRGVQSAVRIVDRTPRHAARDGRRRGPVVRATRRRGTRIPSSTARRCRSRSGSVGPPRSTRPASCAEVFGYAVRRRPQQPLRATALRRRVGRLLRRLRLEQR